MKHFALLLCLLMTVSLFAYDFNDRERIAVFKIKPEMRSALQKNNNRTGIATIDEKLQKLQVSSIHPKFNLSPK